MSRTLKIVIGVVLLVVSARCIFGVVFAVSHAEENARKEVAHSTGRMLSVGDVRSECLGQTAVTEWGEELTVEDSAYDFYRLEIQVKNKSYDCFYGNPAEIFLIYGDSYEDVGQVIYRRTDWDDLFAGASQPMIAGKTQATAVLYVEVRKGVHKLGASYILSWDEEYESLEIELDEKAS